MDWFWKVFIVIMLAAYLSYNDGTHETTNTMKSYNSAVHQATRSQ